MLLDPRAPPGLDISSSLSVLGRPITLSPDSMESSHFLNSSTTSVFSDDSDETIDLDDEDDTMGFPLQRMTAPHSVGSRNVMTEEQDDASEEDDRLTALYRACIAARIETSNDGDDANSESSETSSVAWDEVDFERLVDSLPAGYTEDYPETYISAYPSSSSSSFHSQYLTSPVLSAPLVMHTLALPALPNPLSSPSSAEQDSPTDGDDTSILLLLLSLNTPELRSDPWNPVPRILRAVERRSTVYLFHPPLVPLTPEPAMYAEEQEDKDATVVLGSTILQQAQDGTVAQWIDFLRQVIEGLAFLHENGVVWGAFDVVTSDSAEPSCPPGLGSKEVEMFMMDISSDPQAFASVTHTESPKWTFDRSRYPVKYYFTNFRRAQQISALSDANDSGSAASSPFLREVESCGTWLESLVQNIHVLRAPLLPLTQAMKTGGFSAESARRLFEARARSLSLSQEKDIWEKKVVTVRWRLSPAPREEETKGQSVRKARTISVSRSGTSAVPTRPGMGASRIRVTDVTSACPQERLRAPGPIVRSKSNPNPIPKEKTKKDVFGDLSFSTIPSAPRPPTIPTSIVDPPLRPGKSSYESERESIPPLTPLADSPVFTIPSLASFPASLAPSPTPSSQLRQRRKSLALGTVFSSRKSYAAEYGAVAAVSRPPSLMKIGRSISMPEGPSGSWMW